MAIETISVRLASDSPISLDEARAAIMAKYPQAGLIVVGRNDVAETSIRVWDAYDHYGATEEEINDLLCLLYNKAQSKEK